MVAPARRLPAPRGDVDDQRRQHRHQAKSVLRLQRPTASSANSRAPLSDIRNRTVGVGGGRPGKDSGHQAEPRKPSSSSGRSRSRSSSRGPPPQSQRGGSHTRSEERSQGGGISTAGSTTVGRYPSAPRSRLPPSSSSSSSHQHAAPPRGLMSPAVRTAKKKSARSRGHQSINPFHSVEFDGGPLALRNPSPIRSGSSVVLDRLHAVDGVGESAGEGILNGPPPPANRSASTKREKSSRAGGLTGSSEPAPEKRARTGGAPPPEESSLGESEPTTGNSSAILRGRTEQQQSRGRGSVRCPSPVVPRSSASEVVLAQHELDELIEERIQMARAEWLAGLASSSASTLLPKSKTPCTTTITASKTVEDVLSASVSFASVNKLTSEENFTSTTNTVLHERGKLYKSEAYESRVALRSAEQTIESLRRELDEVRFFHELENDEDGGCAARTKMIAPVGSAGICQGAIPGEEGESSNEENTSTTGGDVAAKKQAAASGRIEAELREEVERLRVNNAELEAEASSLRATVEMCEMAAMGKDEDAVRITSLEGEVQNARCEISEGHKLLEEVKAEKVRMEAQLKEARARAGDMAGNFAEKVERVGALERMIDEMRAEAAGAEGHHSPVVLALRDELDTLNSKLAVEQASHKAEVEKVERLYLETTAQLESLREKADELHTQRQQLEDSRDSATSEVAERHRLALRAKDEVLSGMRSKWKREEEVLRRELAQAQTDLEAVQRFSEEKVTDVRERLEAAESQVNRAAEFGEATKVETGRFQYKIRELEQALAKEESRRKLSTTEAEARLKASNERLQQGEESRRRNEAMLSEATDRLKKVESVVDSLTAELKAKESALVASQAKVEELESDLDGVRSLLVKTRDSSKAREIEIEAKCGKLDHDQSKKEVRIIELERLLSQSKAHRNDLEDNMKDTEEELSGLKAERRDLKTALKEANSESLGLAARVATLGRDMNFLSESEKKLKMQVHEALKESGTREATIIRLSNELASKRTELKSLLSLSAGTNVEMDEMRAKIEKTSRDFKRCEKAGETKLQELRDHLKSAEKRVFDLETDLNQMEEDKARSIKKLEDNGSELKTQIKQITEERNSAVAESKSLEATIQMYDMSIEKTEEETEETVASLESRVRDAKNQCAAVEQRLENESSARTALEKELQQAEAELSSKMDEVDNLLLQLQEREEELKNAKIIATSAFTKIDELTEMIESKNPSTEKDRLDLNREVKRKDIEVQTLRASIVRITEQVDRAEAKNRELEVDLSHAMDRYDELEKSLRIKENPRSKASGTDRRAMINATTEGEKLEYGKNNKVRRRIESEALQRYMSHRFEDGEI